MPGSRFRNFQIPRFGTGGVSCACPSLQGDRLRKHTPCNDTHVHITNRHVRPLPVLPASPSSWGPPAIWPPTSVSPPAWPTASRHPVSCLRFWLDASAMRDLGVDSQDITPLTVVVQDHMVILPQRWPMRHGEERDPEFGSVVHHQSLHVWRNQRGGLVQDSVLYPIQRTP